MIPARALAGEEPFRVLSESKFIAPLQGAEKLSDLIQGGATFGRLPLATVCNRYAVG